MRDDIKKALEEVSKAVAKFEELAGKQTSDSEEAAERFQETSQQFVESTNNWIGEIEVAIDGLDEF